MTVELGVTFDAVRTAKLIRAMRRGLNTSDLLTVISLKHFDFIIRNFDAKGNLIEPWAPLSANTIFVRSTARVGVVNPLADTGAMRQSLVMKPPVGNSVIVKFNDEKAKWHHFGTDPYVIRPKDSAGLLTFRVVGGRVVASVVNHPGLPARKLIPSQSKAEDIAEEALENIINEIVE